ncbi:MAG: hypothetical protein OHK0053_14870 [Microscillaceae bacterium]
MRPYQIPRDKLWKGIIEDLFKDFLRYFYPEWAEEAVDWSQRVVFLDKELAGLYPESAQTTRFADKLVRVPLKNGADLWVLVHIEVQGYRDADFPMRMFTYFYRIRDRYQKEILALAILTDKSRRYHPKKYHYQFLNTRLTYQFDTFKLRNKTEAVLIRPHNPFSIVMQTAFKALQTENLADIRQKEWKLALVRNLLNAGFGAKKVRSVLNFITYYVNFHSKEECDSFHQEVSKITQSKTNMGIEEIIRTELLEAGEKLGLEKGELKKSLVATQNLLKKGKLSPEEIAEVLEVSLDFVLKVQKGEIRVD